MEPVAESLALANQHRQAGRLADAEASFRQALALDPQSAAARVGLGQVYYDQGKLTAAEACFREVARVRPHDGWGHAALGQVLLEQRRLSEAEACFREAVRIAPGYRAAHEGLAASLYGQGKLVEARGAFEAVLRIEPNNAAAHTNLGSVLKDLRLWNEAMAHFRRALELDPQLTMALNNLGAVLADLARHEEAVTCLQAAVAQDPRSAVAFGNLAGSLAKLGRFDEGLSAAQQAIALAPNKALGHCNLATNLRSLGRLDEAIASYRKAIALDPHYAPQHSNLVYLLNHDRRYRREEVFEEHLAWARVHADALMAAGQSHANDRTPNRRLRVGYVSSHFCEHAVNYFIDPILASHDHTAFDVFCYSNNSRNDETNQRLRTYADQWREIGNLSDPQAAEMIRSDKIDILVDLAGHIAGDRLLVFARKPAPVQVTYIGYQNTTGMRAMDYRLTDAWADPPGETDEFYTETLVRLPRSFFCYRPSPNAPPVGPLPALANGYVTFGSFNNFAKVTPEVLATWCRVLQAVPGSRLVILAPDVPSLREYLARTFAGHGIEADRWTLAGRRPPREYRQLVAQVDIALDPFPFNGHTTTCDALWQGVPVVSLAGDAYASRFGTSAHVNLGLEDLIAQSPEQYVEIATRLATDLERLVALRAELRERMAASPLLDFAGFTRHLEAAYRQMWAEWCRQEERVQPVVDAQARIELGKSLYEQGAFFEAEAAFRAALSAAPHHAMAHAGLGLALLAQQKPAEARAALETAVDIDPANAHLRNSLACALLELHREGEAEAQYREAIRLDPGLAVPNGNLGGMLMMQGRHAEAVEFLTTATELEPQFAVAFHNLAVSLQRLDRLDEAVVASQRTIQLNPADATAYANLATCFESLGRLDEAIELHRKAIQLEPGNALLTSNLVYTINLHPGYDPPRILREHLEFGRTHANPLTAASPPHTNDRAPNRRLRVGYVSAHFWAHAVHYFSEPILASHDHTAVEVFCYSNNSRNDEANQRLRSHADQWREIGSLSDEQAAEMIRSDKIDILVDLAGHIAGNRLLVFARKPAPVQVTYIGYQNTTGMRAMDYRLTDAWADPPGETDAFYTEQLVRLPRTFFCYRPSPDAPPVGPLPALANGYVTFGSFNNFAKVTPEVLDVWCRVLQAVPRSRLVILAPDVPSLREYLARTFAGHGIEADRWTLAGRRPPREYRQLVAQVDIALDPFPFNGHTTTCDALWQGVPVVTLAGRMYANRFGSSAHQNLGLEDLVAHSPKHYVEIATRLATDVERLVALRAELRERMAASPLLDFAGFTRHLEAAYRQMWAEWCRQEERVQPVVDAQARIELGKSLYEQGAFFEAEAAFREALSAAPHHAMAHAGLGLALLALQKPAEARAALETAVDIDPANARLRNSLACALLGLHREGEAEAQFREAIRLDPGLSAPYGNLGGMLTTQGRHAEAVGFLTTATELEPQFAVAFHNLAVSLQRLNRLDEAVVASRRAIDLKPTDSTAYTNLGTCFEELGRLDEAIELHQKAIELDPNSAAPYSNLGACCETQGRLDEALELYRKAMDLDPQHARIHSNYIYALNYHPAYDPQAVFSEHCKWGKSHGDPLTADSAPHANDRAPARRLRIGYVSAHFSRHAVNFFIEPILASHDHEQIEVFCYSNGSLGDEVNQQLRANADQWREIGSLSDERAAEMIRGDKIDILVDLAGHIAGNRLLVFARKPAPVQVTYIGYQNTTGMRAMDYRLTDAWADPPGETDAFYTEQLVRLPRTFFCYRPSPDAPPVGPLPALANGYVTFGSFNNFAKVTPEVLATWCRVLQAVPRSRLTLLCIETSELRDRVADLFAKNGIDSSRVDFEQKRRRLEYLKLIARVDIALDPFPFNGHTTTCDALWQGVPVVTLAGRMYANRFGSSAHQNLGLEDLVAHSPKQYVEIATRLATDLERLAALRAELRERMAASPLLDFAGFTRHLEAAYRQMWAEWCRQAGRGDAD